MKKLIALISLLYPLILVAQTINVENKKVADYFKKGASYNCPYENNLYKFNVTLKDTLNYKYEFTLQYNDKKSGDTLIKDIDNSRVVDLVVKNVFNRLKLNPNPCQGDCSGSVSSMLYRKIIDDIVRLNISSRLDAASADEINIGRIIYKPKGNKINYYKKEVLRRRNDLQFKLSDYLAGSVEVTKITIAFEDGIIKDMILTAMIDSSSIQFKNYKSFSVRNPINISQLNVPSNYLFSNYNGNNFIILLSDIIFYERNVISGSGTYIPKNDTISINKKITYVKLYKDNFINNFDIKIFSDVTALQKDNPNGILQFDCRLNLILSTNTPFYWSWLSNKKTSESSLFAFNRISPYILFNKIENGEKSLLLSKYINDTLQEKSFNYATTFDLFKHANIKMGVNLNLITLLTQSKKVRLDISAGLFQTRIDSTLSITKPDTTFKAATIYDQKNLTNWYIMPELGMLFIESDRIEFEMKYGFISSKLVDNNIKQIKTHTQSINHIDDFNIWDPKNWIHKVQCNVNVHPNPKKKETSIFMRATYFWNRNDNNLSLQLGYSTSVTNLINQFKASEK